MTETLTQPIVTHWRITRAKNAGQKPNPHGGEFDKWYIGLQSVDGAHDFPDAYWQRKHPSDVTVEDKVYGKLEEGEYGFRFHMEKEPDGPSRGREATAGTSGSKGDTWKPRAPRREYDPEDMARQTRSAAQDRALKALDLLKGKDGPDYKEPHTTADLQRAITAWTVWFEEDVIVAGETIVEHGGQTPSQIQGAQDSQAGAAPPPAASPGSEKGSADLSHDAHRLDEKLNDNGVTDGDERRWLTEAWQGLPKEKRGIALTALALGDMEAQYGALARLKEIAGPMPESYRDDPDIPFRRPEYRDMFSERERWRF